MKTNRRKATNVQKERMKLETRYLILIVAMIHSMYLLHSVNFGLSPMLHDWGVVSILIELALINIHLYDESKVFRYCFWHRLPILLSLYFDVSRIMFYLEIINIPKGLWAKIDKAVLLVNAFLFIIGYFVHSFILNQNGEE